MTKLFLIKVFKSTSWGWNYLKCSFLNLAISFHCHQHPPPPFHAPFQTITNLDLSLTGGSQWALEQLCFHWPAELTSPKCARYTMAEITQNCLKGTELLMQHVDYVLQRDAAYWANVKKMPTSSWINHHKNRIEILLFIHLYQTWKIHLLQEQSSTITSYNNFLYFSHLNPNYAREHVKTNTRVKHRNMPYTSRFFTGF